MNVNYRSAIVTIALWTAVLGVGASAAAKDSELEAKIQDIDSRMSVIQAEVEELTEDVTREAFERDKLMLQRRFVAGRDFHFLVRDYVGASEIFQAIVTHPTARQLAIYRDAHYYLAESLFQTGYYNESATRFLEIRSRGSGDSYYAVALARLIQVAIVNDEYRQAETYYSELLSSLPPGGDGSLGRYIYGRALFLRGDARKAAGILEEIPEGTDYYPMAQYLLGVMEVKSRNFDGAIQRLRKLKSGFEPVSPEQERVRTQTSLALGRLNYEVNDFPQAVTNYTDVSEKSPEFADAVYESLWVLLTRNDFLLLKIRDHRLDYDSLARDFGGFSDVVDVASDGNDMAKVQGGVDEMQDDISDMRQMFEKIDERLVTLQEQAINRYNEIVQNAPNSPLVPEADLLLGNIYSQAENFDAARDVFRQVQSKYGNMYAQIESAGGRLDDPTVLARMVERGTSTEDPTAGEVPPGVPPEVAYWLAADKDVRKAFVAYEQALRERQDLEEMRGLVDDIELELRKLETDPTFPIFKETYRRSLLVQSQANDLQTKIAGVVDDPEIAAEDADRISSYVPLCAQAVSQMSSLQQKLETQKQRMLAEYRQNFRQLAAPIEGYAPDVDQVYAEATDKVGREASREMEDIENRLASYIRKAEVGIVDADYRQTQASTETIKDLQKNMDEELREFRRQYRHSKPSEPPPDKESADDDDGGEDKE